MRRRSGALHCETEEQLLELASNNQMGLYYNERPLFKEVKFQKQWTLNEAQNHKSQIYQNFDFSQQEQQAKQQLKQLNKAIRYLPNCIVDNQYVRCSIQICVIVPKLEEALSAIIDEETFLDLFLHSQKNTQNCIYKHSSITSSSNSNVFCLETTNFQYSKSEHEKENSRMTPKNWLKKNQTQKIMELLIVKKHLCLNQNIQMDMKKISIIHRIFIVNQNHLQNPLIQIYLKKCHYVIDARIDTLKQQIDPQNQYNLTNKKLLDFQLFMEMDCSLYERGNFPSQFEEKLRFRNVFHKIQEKIGSNQLPRLKDILALQKNQPPKPQKKIRR